VNDQADRIVRCGDAIGAALRGGAQLWTFGNGGSQTDADWIADCFAGMRAWRARSLASDPSVLSALANDVGFERVFARQIAAFARAGDIALGISTSGSSANVVAGIAEAKRRGLCTIGLVGGDGGQLASTGDVDFLLVVPSDSVHRIQECRRRSTICSSSSHALRRRIPIERGGARGGARDRESRGLAPVQDHGGVRRAHPHDLQARRRGLPARGLSLVHGPAAPSA
jgi:D-sedoheptulose 7-phosphate isomerase